MFAMQVLDQQPDQCVAALLHHRKQPHLLLEHVLFQRVADRAQFASTRPSSMPRASTARGHGQQLRQCLAVAFMEPRLDAVDQGTDLPGGFRGHGGWRLAIPVQSGRGRKPLTLTQVNF
jgi:hypothetical protein